MRCCIVWITAISLFSCNSPVTKSALVVQHPAECWRMAFVLYENFDTLLLKSATWEVSTFYHCEAVILAPQQLPSTAYYAPRHRYKADSLPKFQLTSLPNNCETVIGITQKDISTTNAYGQDWGIFGLGYRPGKACIISTHRLHCNSPKTFSARFIKVLLHETGHNLGLKHCDKNPACLMNDARGSIATVDREEKRLCTYCSSLLPE